MAVMIAFQVVGMFEFFKPIHYYLFTKQMDMMDAFFVSPVPWTDVGKSVAVLAAYAVVFFTAGFVIFKRKDVLA
jgi:ABC-type transport system involved in multi-copper enzyme maturation permease subunit